MQANQELKIYDFEVFKALVEIEIERIKRYGKSKHFSIAFLYFPSITKLLIENKPKDIDIFFKLRENIRSVDVLSPVDEDFVFLFFPETDKNQVEKAIERLKKSIKLELVEGVASYPEDGKTARDLFDQMVKIMNDKLLPIIEI
ncbi:hypothetical protein [Sulfurihydrogenibium subterraneum]|uniref:hypothetical protein n=1 Tax=Sulfurihydrogenibium subterraneum TaxID=171121 RepID=UPI0004919EA2|nr:hypothetical protein [Sulfurihydrogenibium subterraneum]